jgi:hypothetical protein
MGCKSQTVDQLGISKERDTNNAANLTLTKAHASEGGSGHWAVDVDVGQLP